MATATAEYCKIVEFSTSHQQSLRIKRDAEGKSLGVIEGVKILGLVSKNKRRYRESAVKNAVSLYEGAKVNVDHNDKRSYADRMGNTRGVHYREGEGLFANFHYNPHHALARQLEWDAENAPENVGFSHVAECKTSFASGLTTIEEIRGVEAVDLVADAATTSSLFEEVKDMSVDSITLEDLKSKRPELIESLTKEVKENLQASGEAQTLKGENERLKEQIADLEAKQKKAELRDTIAEEIKAAGLDGSDEKQCSKLFLESLEIDDEAKRKALIEDRKALVGVVKEGGKPRYKPADTTERPATLKTRTVAETAAAWR